MQPTTQPTAIAVTATTPETKPTEAPTTKAANTQEFLPQAISVWNTTIGADTMTGNCKASVLPVYGLVQVTPKGKKGNDLQEIEWKNQEPKPYVMAKVKPNAYAYSGPTSIGDGTVTMTVSIIDDKTLTMIREFVSNKETACTHTHEYAGEFKWTR